MLSHNIVIHYRQGMLETVSPGEIALAESIIMDLLQEILAESAKTDLPNDENRVSQDYRIQPQHDVAVCVTDPL